MDFFAREAGGPKNMTELRDTHPFEENIFGGNHLADLGGYGKKTNSI